MHDAQVVLDTGVPLDKRIVGFHILISLEIEE